MTNGESINKEKQSPSKTGAVLKQVAHEIIIVMKIEKESNPFFLLFPSSLAFKCILNPSWNVLHIISLYTFNSELESAAIQLLCKDFPFIATEIVCNWERFVQQKGNQYVINLLLQFEIYPPWYLMYAADLLKPRTPNELYPS